MVKEEPFVTRPDLEPVRETADRFLALKGEDLHTFYRIASELTLLPVYRQAFESVFDGAALEDGSLLVLDNVEVPPNRQEYSGARPIDSGFVASLYTANRSHFDRHLRLESSEFDSQETFEKYQQAEKDWRRRLARKKDYHGPWNGFTNEEFTRQDRHRQRRLLQRRAAVVHPLSPVESSRRTEVNSFTAAKRLKEFSRVREGWALGYEPGYEPEFRETGIQRRLSRGVARILDIENRVRRYWIFPNDGPEPVSEDRARKVIETYPRLSDPMLEAALKAQLRKYLVSDEILVYWQYLHLALGTDQQERLAVGRAFLDLPAENKNLVRELFIRPGPAGASEADGVYDSLIWYLGTIATDENATLEVDKIRTGLPPEGFKLSLLGRNSKLLDNKILASIKQAAQDQDRQPFVEELPGDILIGLLGDELMEFCRTVVAVPWRDGADYLSFFKALDDPVQAGWRRILVAESPSSQMLKNLDEFVGLTQEQKEAVLTELALDRLYGAPSAATPSRKGEVGRG